ncbi:MAG: ATP-dependent Clp protease proteolytic subunit [Bdellovibrionota bacterium]
MREYIIWVAKLGTLIIAFFVIVPILLVSVIASSSAVSKQAVLPTDKKTVAVVKLEALIMDSEEITKKLYKQADNDQIKAIVLRINSPGGAVAPSQDIYTAVKAIRKKKPVVVSMGAVAASGGLYAAMSADKVLLKVEL